MSQKNLEAAARESFNDFQNASFPKFARENYPELACANMDRFSYEKGFLAGHAYALEQASEGFEEWFKGTKDLQFRGVVTDFEKVWIAARLSAEKEIAELEEKLAVATSALEVARKDLTDQGYHRQANRINGALKKIKEPSSN